MKSVKRWKAALSALGLALAFFAAAPFMSCSNASEGPSIIVPPPSDGGASSGGTTTDGQGGTQSPDGGSSGGQTQNPTGAPTDGGQSQGGQTQDTTDPALNVPLTLEAIEAGAVVTFSNKAQGAVTYKVNGGEAQTIASGESKAITLAAAGDKVQFFGDNKSYASHPYPSDDWSFESWTRSSIGCSADCYVYGNILSLIKSENFAKVNFDEDASSPFYGFFANNTHIKNKDGEDLLLPATTIAGGCYEFMFYGCSGLTKAPALPATKITSYCYNSMFEGCSNLTSAPSELPATKLEEGCYNNMFKACVSLTTPPALPATTLAKICYSCMFYRCAKLTSAPELPATTLAESCYNSMFDG